MAAPKILIIVLLCFFLAVATHGPPLDKNSDDVVMGRKMGAKWCSMAKVCNHDRVPVCGVSHAGDIMGFRDLCDMFDFNCLRRRNYRQTACPDDKTVLTASRRPPVTSYYDD
ncbi:hypothetical protein O0L34_g3010 [Tuta absoluta]|nr:hypothetical protein O0L34_g3010 [Tuta absoluta]